MKTVSAKEAPVKENPHQIKASPLYDSQHAQVVHITPVDVVFYVLEGRGVVEIGDEKQEVGPDTLIDSPAKIPHCWYNESEAVLRFLVVKVPRPTESTRLL